MRLRMLALTAADSTYFTHPLHSPTLSCLAISRFVRTSVPPGIQFYVQFVHYPHQFPQSLPPITSPHYSPHYSPLPITSPSPHLLAHFSHRSTLPTRSPAAGIRIYSGLKAGTNQLLVVFASLCLVLVQTDRLPLQPIRRASLPLLARQATMRTPEFVWRRCCSFVQGTVSHRLVSI
jgi:hypothetical protein